MQWREGGQANIIIQMKLLLVLFKYGTASFVGISERQVYMYWMNISVWGTRRTNCAANVCKLGLMFSIQIGRSDTIVKIDHMRLPNEHKL